MTSGIHVVCIRCKNVLEEPGALVFGPPRRYSSEVLKLHVCIKCWDSLWYCLLENKDPTEDRGSEGETARSSEGAMNEDYKKGFNDAIAAVFLLLKDCEIEVQRSRRTPRDGGSYCTYQHFIDDIEGLKKE